MFVIFSVCWTLFCIGYTLIGLVHGTYYVLSHLALYHGGGFHYRAMFEEVLLHIPFWPYSILCEREQQKHDEILEDEHLNKQMRLGSPVQRLE